MFTINRLLIISFLLIAHSTHSIYMYNFDYTTYTPYLHKTWQMLNEDANDMKFLDHFNQQTADALRNKQDAALKALLEDMSKKGVPGICEYFKYEVYDQWKRRFDAQYQQSLIDNDWNWLAQPITIYSYE